jgi:hypothetical protein
MKSTIRRIMSGYTQSGRFWLALGAAALVVDAAISFQYGISLTWLHGLGFALVAAFFALLPDAAYSECEARRFGSGLALALLCVPLGMVAFYSHLGYGAGVRVGDMQQTSVQNVRYDDARAKVEENKGNVAMWRKQLEQLQTQNVWVATVSADGLKAQLASADKSIELEGKRGGCGARCLSLMKDKAGLEERIATAERASDLGKRIEATQRIIDGYREASSKTAFRSSPVVNQNNVAAQMFLAFSGADPEKAIDPDRVTASFTSIFIAGGGSLAFMIMAPVGFFLAGRNRLPKLAAPTVAAATGSNHLTTTDVTVFRSRPRTNIKITPMSGLIAMPA